MGHTANTQLIESVFYQAFDQQPIVFFAPGRINLIGEHIDYNDGLVLPAAIDKGIYFGVELNGSDKMHFVADDLDEDFEFVLGAQKSKAGNWRSYVYGVLDLMSKDHDIPGVNVVFGGNIPIGSGLSSSAALTCGLASAINELLHLNYDKKDLAQICQKAEHIYAGVNCGIMDQFAVLMGKKRNALLLDCQDLSFNYIPLFLEDYELVLIDSTVTHDLSATEYNIRRSECEQAMEYFKTLNPTYDSFRDVKISDLEIAQHNLSIKLYKRSVHVVKEIQRTINAADCINNGDLTGFGHCLYQSHESLKSFFEVSCPELDFLVDAAKEHQEIIGSRMMGGGFGGCTINIVKKEGKEEILNTIAENFYHQFDREVAITPVKISNGVSKMNIPAYDS